MSETMDLLNEVLTALRVKYDKANQLMTLTKELDQASDRNDFGSFGMILNMREGVMKEIDKLDAKNRQLLQQLPPGLRQKMNRLLWPDGETVRLDNPLETNIFDTNKQIITLIKKVSDLNDKISRRVVAAQRRG